MAYVYEAADLLMSAQERADDIPLLIAHLGRMGVPALLDKHMPSGGVWGGLSAGWVATLWLAHILSQSDGKLRHVQPWVATHPETLRACLGRDVPAAEVHELRLRELLLILGNDAIWYDFEAELNQHLLDCYELDVEQITVQRMDSWAWFVLPDGIVQISQTRGWRPGALKINVLHTLLEPLGLPLATAVVSSRSAAVNALGTLIYQTQAALGRPGVLFTGEQMRAIEARAAVQAAGGIYVCQLPEPKSAEREQGWIGTAMQPLSLNESTGKSDVIEGYEWYEGVRLGDGGLPWQERRLLLRSRAQTEAAEERLRERLAQACAAVLALNERKRGKRRPRTMPALHQAVQDILESYQVAGLLTLAYDEAVEERTVRRYRGRPTAVRIEREVQVTAEVNEAAMREAVTHLAWELYATNLPSSVAVADWLLQRPAAPPSYERLNGRPISLTPASLQHDEQAVGLVRLLSLGLRTLVLLEAAVYRRLAAEESDSVYGSERSGDPSGAPLGDSFRVRRRVALLAGERLLEAFREIMVVSGRGARKLALTPLTPLQRRVLYLLKLPPETY